MSEAWQEPVTIRPIGVVVSPLKDFDQPPTYGDEGQESYLLIREDLTEGLMGLEHFSHLHVIYRQHRREDWKRRDLIPEGKDKLLEPIAIEPVCKGIYTSRSPARPSGIGSCIVELVRHEGNKLFVKGLDAIDGTPLLDIKIYIPKYDCFPWAEAPLHWCQKNTMTTTSRLLHWDTMNVSLTLGMRAGQKAMHALGLVRSSGAKCAVRAGGFFAQGVEAVTGCSPLHGTMHFEDKPKKPADWFVRLEFEGRSVEVKIKDQLYSGADEVLGLEDEHLFASCIVTPAGV